MPRQFGVPEKLIQKVLTGQETLQAYAPYLQPLIGRHVIGTNVAYLLGAQLVSVLYFCDLPFWRHNFKQLNDFHNLKVTDAGNLPASRVSEQINIKKLKRDVAYGLTEHRDAIRWNRNAGGGAINLAYHFGVKRVYLLGYDMRPDVDGRTHWHNGLPSYEKPTTAHTFKRFLECFPIIAKDAKRLKIEIVNVNPESAIENFPKVKLSEVL